MGKKVVLNETKGLPLILANQYGSKMQRLFNAMLLSCCNARNYIRSPGSFRFILGHLAMLRGTCDVKDQTFVGCMFPDLQRKIQSLGF